MTPFFRLASLLVVVAMTSWLSGCDSATLLDADRATVSIGVELLSTAPKSGGVASDSSLSITGDNGTLTITDVRFVLDRFELTAEAGSSDLEIGPLFVDVPLSIGEVELVAASVPLGSYDEFGFEIDDLSDGGAADSLLGVAIRSEFPDWPSEASVAVVGSFTPAGGGSVRPFTIYIGADIDVELDLDPILELADAAIETALTIGVDPTRWLPIIQGDVPDLSPYDYGQSGSVIPIELSISDGFEIRHGLRNVDR